MKKKVVGGLMNPNFKIGKRPAPPAAEQVNHPAHYGGEDNPYEVIKVIEAWDLGFHLGTAVKYIPRAGVKDPAKEVEDLEKSVWYINRRIKQLKARKTKL